MLFNQHEKTFQLSKEKADPWTIPDRSGDRSEHDPVVPLHLADEGTTLPELQAAAVGFRPDLLLKSADAVDRLAERTATVEN